MNFGKFEIAAVNFGTFRLDGGSMFGSVPKNLWERRVKADHENCVALALRSLVIRHADRTFLIDTGIGDKWNEKQINIFGIKNVDENELGLLRADVTDLILTHLHFDHAGGVSRFNSSGQPELLYPQAKIYVQRANFDNARSPNLKERASYLTENVDVLVQGNLNLLDGNVEIYPGISVQRVDGHTVGQQIIRVEDDDNVLLFATDLIPTTHHIPIAFHMGYDICAATILREKTAFLENAVAEDAIVFFQHDLEIGAGRIQKDEGGRFSLGEMIDIS